MASLKVTSDSCHYCAVQCPRQPECITNPSCECPTSLFKKQIRIPNGICWSCLTLEETFCPESPHATSMSSCECPSHLVKREILTGYWMCARRSPSDCPRYKSCG